MEQSKDRLAVLAKIEQYEKEGRFSEDVEPDAPARVLLPAEIEYIRKGAVARVRRAIALRFANKFFREMMKSGEFRVGEIIGAEHLAAVEGAIVTCNHFHMGDTYATQQAFLKSGHKKRLYRVIKEGNFTSTSGVIRRMMQDADTLPLSSDRATMVKFLRAVTTLLREGNCVLVYPEQSMWWNYRKPRPFESGAFDLAVRADVPVVPMFIATRDLDTVSENGFPTKRYTVFVGEALYPDDTLPRTERRDALRAQNFAFCKQTYEDFYGTALSYNEKDGEK